MNKLSYEELQTYTYLGDFNSFHGTNFDSWDEYFMTIGNEDCAVEDKVLEYKQYCQWVDIQNTPLMKALK